MLINTLGGVGLFLIGMVLLTDGLKTAAGDALQRILTRFTGGRLSAVAAGATITAAVQSSSATTVTVIGFVSAGLLTFAQSVGLIFGANLGSTSTGWLVALFGLKISLLPAALVFVGVGALARLLLRGKAAGLGLALAGFGLIFVGIDTLQVGMAALNEHLEPASLPGASFTGRLLLVLLGAAMTVVMQSSSAAVATTLTAVSVGTIDLSQAAALVIGQNFGTTVTALLASVGASVPARRTAVSHVAFNLVTGSFGLLVLPVFVTLATRWLQRDGDAAIAIAAWHTTLNFAGIVLLLPVIDRFAALITRTIPDRGPVLTRYLDRSVALVAPVAVEAAHRALRDVLQSLVIALRSGTSLASDRATRPRGRVERAAAGDSVRVTGDASVEAARQALRETRTFLTGIRSESESATTHARHVAALHAIDHLRQLAMHGLEHTEMQTLKHDPGVAVVRNLLDDMFGVAEDSTSSGAVPDTRAADALLPQLRRAAADTRAVLLTAGADGTVSLDSAMDQLDALRWCEAVGHHLQRALFHLSQGAGSPLEVNGDLSPDR